jgi:hypothetical protein
MLHPVIAAGLSEEHAKVFDQIALNNYRDGVDKTKIKDLELKRLLERDEIDNIRIPLAVFSEWANYDDDDLNTD